MSLFFNPRHQEKRDFIRMRVDSPVTMAITERGEPLPGICRDLSGGGMLVEVDKAPPVGTELNVTLASSHGHAPVLEAVAEVARVMEQPDANASRVGLRLTEILT